MAIFSLLSVALMTVDSRHNHLEGIRSTISFVVIPLRYVVNMPFELIDWTEESLSTRRFLLDENHRLRQLQLLQEVRLQKLASIEQENIRLRSLLQSSKQEWEKVLIAEIIAVDFDPYRHFIQLNKGSHDNIFIGHPVVDANGIIGQISHIDPLQSNAILLTDPNHAIPVRVLRNGLRAVAMGTGESILDIPHIPNNADIKTGDILVSSGLGNRFPADYPVAVVVTVERNPHATYATISAQPTAKLNEVQEVLLVWPHVPKEPASE